MNTNPLHPLELINTSSYIFIHEKNQKHPPTLTSSPLMTAAIFHIFELGRAVMAPHIPRRGHRNLISFVRRPHFGFLHRRGQGLEAPGWPFGPLSLGAPCNHRESLDFHMSASCRAIFAICIRSG